MKKEKYLFFYLILFLLMTIGAFGWQIFMPSIADKYSTWAGSKGWQEEIALWNIGIDIGIVITLITKNVEYAKILCVIATALCFLLGGHHFIYALTSTTGNTLLHWIGAIEVLLIGGVAGIFAIIKSEKYRKVVDYNDNCKS